MYLQFQSRAFTHPPPSSMNTPSPTSNQSTPLPQIFSPSPSLFTPVSTPDVSVDESPEINTHCVVPASTRLDGGIASQNIPDATVVIPSPQHVIEENVTSTSHQHVPVAEPVSQHATEEEDASTSQQRKTRRWTRSLAKRAAEDPQLEPAPKSKRVKEASKSAAGKPKKKKLTCSICPDKSFASNRDLQRHYENTNIHQPLSDRFRCGNPACTRGFARKDSLKRHYEKKEECLRVIAAQKAAQAAVQEVAHETADVSSQETAQSAPQEPFSAPLQYFPPSGPFTFAMPAPNTVLPLLPAYEPPYQFSQSFYSLESPELIPTNYYTYPAASIPASSENYYLSGPSAPFDEAFVQQLAEGYLKQCEMAAASSAQSSSTSAALNYSTHPFENYTGASGYANIAPDYAQQLTARQEDGYNFSSEYGATSTSGYSSLAHCLGYQNPAAPSFPL